MAFLKSTRAAVSASLIFIKILKDLLDGQSHILDKTDCVSMTREKIPFVNF